MTIGAGSAGVLARLTAILQIIDYAVLTISTSLLI